MKSRFIRLSKELIDGAIKDGRLQNRSPSNQIEFYYNLGRLAEQYDDLPISMIKSLMISTRVKADIPFNFMP